MLKIPQIAAGMTVAFIGCGKVADFHADALTAIGARIQSVCGRSSASSNAARFQIKYGVAHRFSNAASLLFSDTSDVLWVVSSWDQTDTMLESLIDDGRPALVEKPMAVSSHRLTSLIEMKGQPVNLYCGMNRRHYDFVPRLKERIHYDPIRFAHLTISEQTSVNDLNDPKEALRVQNFWLNSSIHEIDLLRHLIGDLEVRQVYRQTDLESGWLTSVNAVLEASEGGYPVFVSANWNSSEGKSLLLETSDRTMRLRPMETLTTSSGLKRVEPTRKVPIAQYVPDVLEVCETSRTFKPGFLNQAHLLIEAIQAGTVNQICRESYTDAIAVLELIEALVGPEFEMVSAT